MRQKPEAELEGCCQGVSRSDVLHHSIRTQIKMKNQMSKA